MTLALAFVNRITAPIILERQAQDQVLARKDVLPIADNFKKIDFAGSGSVLEAYAGTKGGVTVGYAINIAPDGYGGKIQAIVGIDLNLKVTGVKITELNETPGLGAKVNDPKWTAQYLNKGAKEFSVVKTVPAKDDEILAVSGATISSRAVTKGINEALAVAMQLKVGSISGETNTESGAVNSSSGGTNEADQPQSNGWKPTPTPSTIPTNANNTDATSGATVSSGGNAKGQPKGAGQ